MDLAKNGFLVDRRFEIYELEYGWLVYCFFFEMIEVKSPKEELL